ncbi:bestrophin-4 isoform X2 [Nerophis lumbriciformis]|uniref:bestrophin-4 isoform X2 n=1 Tax=Nerophis lumbriciformis TaxID=546530 RepID=UPI002ADF6928|nr:bestrophin-1-like isoform X2 [Nerophis lumbriciformis]
MTVTYSRRVADAGLGTFFHLLLRWKGSIYKLLYRELIIFTLLYTAFSLVYRFVLNIEQKRLFEKLSIYCDRYAELIPVSFVLGLMTSEELRHLEDLPSPHNKFWIPCMWFVSLALRARTEGRINNDVALTAILTELNSLRAKCMKLYGYDWISLPLVYTQVVTVAVYSFFLACLIGRQFLDPAQSYPGHDLDFYLPVFTLLQFFFYVGWLKVAEQLINPFGEDDDDFETNWLVDRNLQVSLLSVDEMYNSLPLVEKDMYWNESDPRPPYTTASADHCKPSFMGSALNISVPKEEMEFQSNLEQIKENEEANYSTPLLGGLGRLLGVQSPSFPRSSRVSLLRRRPGAPLSRFPLYLHTGAQSIQNQTRQPLNSEQDHYSFSGLPLYERPGFYSCPQTPIHCVPPAVPRPRPARRPQNEWNRSCSSLAPPTVGSQLLPPDTPNHIPPPSSAFPWLSEDDEMPTAPAFSFPDAAPELCPISKLRRGHGLLSRRPPPPCLTLDALPSADSQSGPLSARTMGSGGERVFSFTPPSRPAQANPSNPNSSSGSINVTSGNSAGTAAGLCNSTSLSSFSNHCNFNASVKASNGGLNNLSASNSAPSPQEVNQPNSPNDSGISLAEGDLLGVLVEGGRNKPAAGRKQD